MMMIGRNRSPIFTTSQWQEFEQQALIFKYMVSGVPIPPDLISTVRRSLEYSSMSSRFIPHQPVGWGSFEMGLGRKADPEPGRCRRTDGKKWRCSKAAHPDSKYCERHMHRGRNRSRKLVEVISSTSSSTTTAAATAITELSVAETYPFLCSHSSSSRPPGSFSSPQNNPPHLFLDSGSYSQTDKESVTPLTMSSSPSGYSQSRYFQSLTGESREHHQQQKEKNSFLLGTEFKSERPIRGGEKRKIRCLSITSLARKASPLPSSQFPCHHPHKSFLVQSPHSTLVQMVEFSILCLYIMHQKWYLSLPMDVERLMFGHWWFFVCWISRFLVLPSKEICLINAGLLVRLEESFLLFEGIYLCRVVGIIITCCFQVVYSRSSISKIVPPFCVPQKQYKTGNQN